MFVVPYHKLEQLGIENKPQNMVVREQPMYITPHFVKDGRELTIEDDIKLLMNGGTPYSGFVKTLDDLNRTNAKCVNWFYLNLKHISTIFTKAILPGFINRDKDIVSFETNYGSNYESFNFYIPYYIFVKDEKLGKVFFDRAYKICHGLKKLYPVLLPNFYKVDYANYIYDFLLQYFTTEELGNKESINAIEIFSIDNINYIHFNSLYIKMPLDINDIESCKVADYGQIPGFTIEEYNRTKQQIILDGANRTNYVFPFSSESLPDSLKEKIIGVTPMRGLPIFDYVDLIEAGFTMYMNNITDNPRYSAEVYRKSKGIKTNKTILDIPLAVILYRNGQSTYEFSTFNNLQFHQVGDPETYKYFFNFQDFHYKNPISGQHYSLFGYAGEERDLVLNNEIKQWMSANYTPDGCYEGSIIIKPEVKDGDYGLGMVLYDSYQDNLNYTYTTTRPDSYSAITTNRYFNTQFKNYRTRIASYAKDATIYRTPKNADYIYKDNPREETKNHIMIDYWQSEDNFVIFDRVVKNVIDNNNEWDETKDTRIDFECDGYRDLEALKWVEHIPMQTYENYDVTYQINSVLKDMTPITQLVDYKMKYISNQFQKCPIYIVDIKYFKALGHSELYKTLLPFRCVFFTIDDMYLYTEDGKIDKPNPKYFSEEENSNEFVYNLQLFDKFSIKHFGKVFEVVWDTKKANNTDFTISGDKITYTVANSPLDYYATIFKSYQNGIISLDNVTLNTEMK